MICLEYAPQQIERCFPLKKPFCVEQFESQSSQPKRILSGRLPFFSCQRGEKFERKKGMTPTVPLKLTRLVLAFGVAVMQCSCSRNREVKGEIFIVTAGHESVKLGLVEIRAFEAAQLNALIESVKKKIAEQEAQLAPISKAADKLESSAKQEDDDARHKWIEGFKRFRPAL